jgi:hypothetical protein
MGENLPCERERHLHIRDSAIPACAIPCPWLDQLRWKGEYPYYLWDTKSRSTVRCPSQGVDYLVISHTWGRWRIRGENTHANSVPWPVPRNEIFDVIELPEIISRVPFDTQYVWFDLVFIPQDGSELQEEEIGRQAFIFNSAKWAIVWFNRIEDWSGLGAAVSWISHKYLTSIKPEETVGETVETSHELFTELFYLANQSSGLAGILTERRAQIDHMEKLPFPFQDQHTRKSFMLTPDAWYTSIWTL